MTLEGEKLYLRPLEKDDLPFFVEWLSDSQVHQFTSGRSYTMEEEIEWFNWVKENKDELVFSIFFQNSHQIIGNCAVHFNQKRKDQYHGKTFLGLMIGKKAEWGKGYGTEAIQLLLRYLKTQFKEKEIYLTVFTANQRAIKCYEKCGFKILEKRKAPERPEAEEYVMKIEL